MTRLLENSFVFSYCPLSNDFTTPYEVDNIRYVNTAQHYASCKALHFNDYESFFEVVTDERKAIEISKCIRNFKLKEWELNAEVYMRRCLEEKFKRNKLARSYLLNTHSLELVCASPHISSYWTVGRDISDECVNDFNSWRGYNVLGLILTDIRADLMK